MNKLAGALLAGLMIGAQTAAFAQAKPAAAAPKGPSAEEKATDKAIANYRKNKGIAMDAKPAMGAKAGKK